MLRCSFDYLVYITFRKLDEKFVILIMVSLERTLKSNLPDIGLMSNYTDAQPVMSH